MEASLAHRKAIAISFPFNGWGSWTDDDIQTAVQVRCLNSFVSKQSIASCQPGSAQLSSACDVDEPLRKPCQARLSLAEYHLS